MVYTSSVAALGAHGREQPADESASFNLAHTRDAYYFSKFRAEQVALDYSRRGLPVVIVNPTNPCGPRDIGPTPNGQLMINVIRRKLLGYVDGGINVSDVTDTAIAHLRAMEKGRPGEKYVLGNANLSVKEYFTLIAEIACVKPPALRIPRFAAVLFGYLYQAGAEITRKPPITTAAWVRVGSHYSFWDSSKAVNELGMPQTPVRQSITSAIDWFRQNGYLRADPGGCWRRLCASPLVSLAGERTTTSLSSFWTWRRGRRGCRSATASPSAGWGWRYWRWACWGRG